MNIEITPKKTDGVERLLQITVPVETVRDAEENAARRYASQVRLPGFRPGKAPAAMVRKKFADAIRQETVERLVQEAYQEVVEREQLKLASQPHVHDLKFETGEPLTFELHLEVRPTLELSRTQGFRVTRAQRAVTEEAVKEQVEALREQRAAWNPVEERPAPQDMVTVLLATADEDGTIPEGREYRLVLGAGQAIEGIEEVVMELTPGQTVERPVKWPDDFPDEAQRAKTKMVRVTLNDVKRRTLPPLDDAFAREVGDFDSLEALTKAVRDDLSQNAEREAEADVRQKLLDDLAGANPFEVPPSWVAQLVDAYANAYQVPEEDRDKKAGRLREIERALTEEKVFKWLLERNTVESANG
jgi:trigger factor